MIPNKNFDNQNMEEHGQNATHMDIFHPKFIYDYGDPNDFLKE